MVGRGWVRMFIGEVVKFRRKVLSWEKGSRGVGLGFYLLCNFG